MTLNFSTTKKEVETTEEQINNTSGKFDELNSILSVTQQRLNKFKVSVETEDYQWKHFKLIVVSFITDSLW